MDNILNSIEQACNNGNYYVALITALTIPDICASLEATDGKTNGKKYTAWVEKYIQPLYTARVGGNKEPTVFLNGSDCYAIRCAILHNGSDDIKTQSAQEVLTKFSFRNHHNWHCNLFGNNITGAILQVDVTRFCMDICQAAKLWLASKKQDVIIQDRLKLLFTIYEKGDFGNLINDKRE